MSSIPKTVSIPEELFKRGEQRREELEYKNFSEYIQALIRADIMDGGDHIRETAKKPKAPPGAGQSDYWKAKRGKKAA